MTVRDCLLTNARLADGRRVSVHVLAGRIAEIAEHIAGDANAPTFDLGGDLLLPGFVDAHIHLDKTYLGLPWMSNESGLGIGERVAYEREMEKRISYPVADRAGKLIELMISQGTTHIRAHVDVDPEVKLTRLHGLLEARAKYCDVVDIQIVAFPQLGVVSRSGMVDLLAAALADGANVIGGIDPGGVDGDVTGQLNALFGLATKHGVGLDLHLHTAGSLGIHEIEQVAIRTRANGMGGCVIGSHCHGLGDANPAVQRNTGERLAEAGVALFNYGPGWLPIPPFRMLHDLGVTVFSGSDNVRDAWQPYGTGDMLERAWILAYRSGFRRDADFQLAYDMTTTHAARAIGLERYGLAVGNDADFVVLDAENVPEAIARRPARRYVMKRGRMVARNGRFTKPLAA